MGQRVCQLTCADPCLDIVAAIVRPGSNIVGTSCAAHHAVTYVDHLDADLRADVIIDFSTSDGADRAIELARRGRMALVVGTTGLSDAVQQAAARAAERIAVLIAPNTSTGVALLSQLARQAAIVIGPTSDISLLEAHRKGKRDAPSGTALLLADILRGAGATVEDAQILSIRGGDVFGEHVIRFAMEGEYVELTHRATGIDLFARGALRAAAWLAGRKPGLYSMQDVLKKQP
ncbi:MAG: 4-hydroxy-tetrahydrodipicolinate reductase [Phycisphaerales bacterium]|nr:4-hydroxy-tetrahydrodipicolinate reductase [Phycisphaerales bacterium]